MTFDPERYVRALQLAAYRHRKDSMPAGHSSFDPAFDSGFAYPYLVHVTSVTAEVIAALPGFDSDLAIPCALLHDTIEDTAHTDEDKAALADQIAREFGEGVRDGVLALTKRDKLANGTPLPKSERMADSLRRIREQPYAVWAVKLADRITNLAPPPTKWNRAKCAEYQAEARVILDALRDGNAALANRLAARIDAYPSHWPAS